MGFATVLAHCLPELNCQHVAFWLSPSSPEGNRLLPLLFWAFPFTFSPGLTLPGL